MLKSGKCALGTESNERGVGNNGDGMWVRMVGTNDRWVGEDGGD